MFVFVFFVCLCFFHYLFSLPNAERNGPMSGGVAVEFCSFSFACTFLISARTSALQCMRFHKINESVFHTFDDRLVNLEILEIMQCRHQVFVMTIR